MLRKLRRIQRLAQIQQMHVRVVESRTYETTAQVRAYGFTVGESKDHCIGTDREDFTVFDQKGLPESILSGVDLSVVPDCSHAVASSAARSS